MTEMEFKDFCSITKADHVELEEYGSVLIYFETGEYIRLQETNDGIEYVHQFEELTSSASLIRDLREMSDGFVKDLITKYGDNGTYVTMLTSFADQKKIWQNEISGSKLIGLGWKKKEGSLYEKDSMEIRYTGTDWMLTKKINSIEEIPAGLPPSFNPAIPIK